MWIDGSYYVILHAKLGKKNLNAGTGGFEGFDKNEFVLVRDNHGIFQKTLFCKCFLKNQ